MRRHFSAIALLFAGAISFSLFGCDDGGSGTGAGGEAGVGGGMGGMAGEGGSAGEGGEGGQGGEPDVTCRLDTVCEDDQYCRVISGETNGVCVPGCREDGCEEGRACDLERRVCVRDLSCSTDDECVGGEYCGEGTCTMGCRLGDADDCPRNELGEPRACDPETHACVVQVVCCGEEDACSLELPDSCDNPITGQRGCFNPNPCQFLCSTSPDCEAGYYCTEMGRCQQGCRLRGVSGCLNDRVCDPETRTCVRPPCVADGECANDMFCDGTVCLPGCRHEPDNCPQDRYCNERHRCAEDEVRPECLSDDDCIESNGIGWNCVNRECEPPCIAHSDCGDGSACIEGVCEEGECRDDFYENNDEAENARPLNFDGLIFDTGGQTLRACTVRDVDWYVFETPQDGMTIRVSVLFEHADGDIDAALYRENAVNPVARGASQDDNEELFYAAGVGQPSPQGRWYIKVNARGFAENGYGMRVEMSRGLGEDEAEDDDTPQEATVLAMPELQAVTRIEDRTIHFDDEDWFAVDMGQADGLNIRLDMLGNDLNRDSEFTFELFGPGMPALGAEPLSGPNNAGGGEDGPRYVEFSAGRPSLLIQDGRYFVRVLGLNENQAGRYRLTISVDRENILCLADAAEPNNAANTAYDFNAVDDFVRVGFDGTREIIPNRDHSIPGLNLCGEDDWFRISLRDGDVLEARIERSDAAIEGDTLIEIYDEGSNLLEWGRNGEAVNVARLRDLVAGNYLIRAHPVGIARTGYSMVVYRTAGPLNCEDDRFDSLSPNEDAENAVEIESGNYEDLTLCGAEGDEDWYSFTLETLSTIELDVTFFHEQGDVELDLYFENQPDPVNLGMPDGHSSTDNENLSLDNSPPGQYFVRVRGLNDPNVRYGIGLQIRARDFICEDDPNEPNESILSATQLGRQVVDSDDQWICLRRPADYDMYFVVVPEGEGRLIASSFLYGDDGDLFLHLYDPDGMLLGGTGGVARGNSKQCIIIEPGEGLRGFFVRVAPLSINHRQGDERLDYGLRVERGIDANGDGTVDDDCSSIAPETPGVIWPRL